MEIKWGRQKGLQVKGGLVIWRGDKYILLRSKVSGMGGCIKKFITIATSSASTQKPGRGVAKKKAAGSQDRNNYSPQQSKTPEELL